MQPDQLAAPTGAELLAWERMVQDVAIYGPISLTTSLRRRCALIVADTLGVITAGARTPEVHALVARRGQPLFELPHGGTTIIGHPATATDPVSAAFVNATSGTFLELDEGIRPTGHPSIQVAPAALAVAEATGAHGDRFLRAFAAGYEVVARLFQAYEVTYPLHPHGNLGAVGAAVSAALLAGTDPLRAARIAATSPLLSLWDACHEGATARNSYTGHAAALGVRSIQLDRAGFTGSSATLETAFGRVAGRPRDLEALCVDPSQPLAHHKENYLKVYSACALVHGGLEGAMQLGPIDVDRIGSIRVATVRNNHKVLQQPRPNDLSARFSLPYAVAHGLMRGTTGLDFAYHTDVAELARRVEITFPEVLESSWPRHAPTVVSVEVDGALREVRVDDPLGHYSRPLTDADVRSKFASLVAHPAADRVFDAVLGLADDAPVAAVLQAFDQRMPGSM